MKEHWPNYSSTFNNKAHNIVSGSSIPFDMDTPFSTLFESGPDSGLFDCINLNNNTAAHWVCALLNATPGPTLPARTGLNFPYTGAEVIALYKGKQKDAALIFFQAYLDNK
jgi:hypothetical protein